MMIDVAIIFSIISLESMDFQEGTRKNLYPCSKFAK